MPRGGKVTLPSRYPGSRASIAAFLRAVADVYDQSGHGAILGFEVRDADGALVGRFEGFVGLADGATPARLSAAMRRQADATLAGTAGG